MIIYCVVQYGWKRTYFQHKAAAIEFAKYCEDKASMIYEIKVI